MDFIKDKWEWIVGTILLLLGIFSSTKTKNNVSEKDNEAKRKREEELRKRQEALSEQHAKNIKDIYKEKEEKEDIAKKEVNDLKEKFKNDPKALSEYLRSKGLKG